MRPRTFGFDAGQSGFGVSAKRLIRRPPGGWSVRPGGKNARSRNFSKIQRGTRRVLRGDLQADMCGPDVMELFGHDVLREFGLVAFAAQMREVKLLQIGGHDLRGRLGGGGVGEMTVPSKDTLFQRPGSALTFLQHFHIVVGFQNNYPASFKLVFHQPGCYPQICRYA